ncbi:hypothetical protein [Chromobacterium haemolyticum]|uniref:hypothetical protein n=1 Tax=Chromobacterium TaxID=535 RepID=UPI0040561809
MITKEQLTELHAAAEAAHRPGVFWYQQDMLERFTRHFTGAELDATYIAAANPATVLALMADNEAKAARIAKLEQEQEHDHWKAKHDNQVQRARILLERPDMPLERVKAYERYAALEQDAARYRELRDGLVSGELENNPMGEAMYELGKRVCGERGPDAIPTAAEFDAAIDAAMTTQAATERP